MLSNVSKRTKELKKINIDVPTVITADEQRNAERKIANMRLMGFLSTNIPDPNSEEQQILKQFVQFR